MSLPNGESLLVESNLLDRWDVTQITRNRATLLNRADNLANAVTVADRFVRAEHPEATRLVERSARWRRELPTDKQRELLARNGIPAPEGLTRGQAAQMISLVLLRECSSAQPGASRFR